jgi:apolipoprotein N-acyltransferase
MSQAKAWDSFRCPDDGPHGLDRSFVLVIEAEMVGLEDSTHPTHGPLMAMATTLATKVEARPVKMVTDGLRVGMHPALLATASALLLWLSFPPADCGYLAWVALVPLFLLVRSERRAPILYFAAWLGGEIFWVLAIHWIRLTDPSAWLAWLVMATFLSLWWPAFVALTRRAVLALRVPLVIAAPVVWVALEYVRAHVLTGFPWYYLAHAQYRYLPLIQVADLAGAWGLSLLLALVNAWVVELVELPLFDRRCSPPRLARAQVYRAIVTLLLVSATFAYGGVRLATARFRPGPRVALLQSNIQQEVKRKAQQPGEILGQFRTLITQALAAKPDLVVWPETSYPRGYPKIHPRIGIEVFARQARAINPKATPELFLDRVELARLELNGWTDAMDVAMLVGATMYDFRPNGLAKYNSAMLFEPRKRDPQTYHKLHLVPFGEYVPLIQTFPWLTRLTPYHGELVPSLTFGPRPEWFEWKGLRLATAICFEDTVPHVVRRFFAEAPAGRQPDLLINISNDGWFRGSSELDEHLAISAFRAVENRVPIVRAVNTGGTALIDGNGTITASLPRLTEAQLTGTVQLDDRTTFYSRSGDWLPQACLIGALLAIPLGWRRRNKRTVGLEGSSHPIH